MKPIYPLNVQNNFHFNSSPRDFTVEEIPLYTFSGEGEHLILKVRKKELTTWEMIEIFSSALGVPKNQIGYAGLKDKHAMTIQYISLPANSETKLAQFSHENLKILDTTRHNNKIRVGHLSANRFSMRLKKVGGIERDKLNSTLEWIKQNGIPNYFGNQRFGTDGNNWEDGKKLIDGTLKIRDKKTREFLISAYQSYLFNGWLSKRMELSHLLDHFSEEESEKVMGLPKGTLAKVKTQPHFFKLLEGDVMMHYPHGRLFLADDLMAEAVRFASLDIAPTGPIPGNREKRAEGVASLIETPFMQKVPADGGRRYAWIGVRDISHRYIEEKAHYELEFTLPKGSYATNLLDVLRGKKDDGSFEE